MNEAFFAELSAWLMRAGLAGTSENDIVCGFCHRCVPAGLPLVRTTVLIDTLHPVHEGRLFRWGFGPTESPLLEYGRTSPDGLAATGFDPKDVEAAERRRHSPFYRMLQTGESLLRRPRNEAAKHEFPSLSYLLAAGMTDYVAIISRFAADTSGLHRRIAYHDLLLPHRCSPNYHSGLRMPAVLPARFDIGTMVQRNTRARTRARANNQRVV